jgi:hypothetical protein
VQGREKQTSVPARTNSVAASDRADFYEAEVARHNRHLRVAADLGADNRVLGQDLVPCTPREPSMERFLTFALYELQLVLAA